MGNRDFLLSMLEDASDANASLVMKELLDSGEAEAIIAENMDSPSETMRRRIHQMSSILERRRLLDAFPGMVNDSIYTHWECLLCLNAIFEFRVSMEQIDGMMDEILDGADQITDIRGFRSFIERLGILIDDSTDNFITKYLVSDVLVHNNGAPSVVSAVVQRAGELCGWETRMGHLDGGICLLDKNGDAIMVRQDWEVLRPAPSQFIPWSVHSYAVEILSKIYTSACIDQITSVMLDARILLDKIV